MNKITIICPIYNEEKYIAACIKSILIQDIDKNLIEVLFIDGGSTDNTVSIIKEYQPQNHFIKLYNNPEKIVPVAMNIGLDKAQGDIIIRIDAHSKYESNYISTLVKYLTETGADNVGSVCRTDVLNKTPISLAIKEVLSHPFGVGNSQFRIGVNKVTEVDTVPFGCWKRDVFSKYGNYNERLIRNQDIEFNKRIIRGGGKIYLVPDTYCTYYARETLKPLSRNNYQNGLWNILTVYITNELSSLSMRHFIPLLFLLGLVLPIALSFIYIPFIWLSLIALLSYLVLAIYFSYKITKGNSEVKLINLVLVFLTLHLSYGLGSLIGLLKLPFTKK